MCPVNTMRGKKSFFTVVELKRKLGSKSTDKFVIFLFLFSGMPHMLRSPHKLMDSLHR